MGGITLGLDWLEQRYEEQKLAASEKYRPDLQVDVPIQDDLLALGFDQSILKIFERYRREVLSSIDELSLMAPKDDAERAALYQAITDAGASLKATAAGLAVEAGDPATLLEPLMTQLDICQDAIYAAQEHERALQAAWRELPDDDPGKTEKPPERASSYGVRGLSSAIDELKSWLDSSVGHSFRRRSYLLTGQAGSGKTHLFLDATRGHSMRADPRSSWLVLASVRVTFGTSIADQLGLEPAGADVLLGAMDAAGEAPRTVVGSRLVIFIDAMNDAPPRYFWRVHLPAPTGRRSGGSGTRALASVLSRHLPGTLVLGRDGGYALTSNTRTLASLSGRSATGALLLAHYEPRSPLRFRY